MLKKAVQDLQQENQQLQQAAVAAPPPQAADSGGASKDKKRINQLVQERGQMASTLQERDQHIRATAQELDTLGFQNKQLTRRLELLQEDANSKDASSRRGSKSTKKMSKAAEDALQLQEEELRRKIIENESLHRRRQEEGRGYEQKIRELQQQLEASQVQVVESQRVDALKSSESADVSQRFHLERVQLNQRITDMQSSLSEARAAIDVKDAAFRAAAAKSSSEIEALEELAASKGFFDDTATKAFNALNVPPSDDAGSGKAADINKQILKAVRSFASNFSNLLTYFEERAVHVSSIQPGGMSKPAADCCAALSGHAKYIKPLDRSFTMYHDGTATLGPFAGSFSNFESYLKRLLPHMQHAIEDENGFPDCTSMLKATNIAVVGALQDIVSEVSSMNTHVAAIGQQDKGSFSNTQNSVFAAVSGVSRILAAFTALASHFSTKLSQEQQLARSNDQSKSTDSMISQAMQSIVTTVEELVTILEENKSTLTAGTSYAVRGVPAASIGGPPSLEVQGLEERARRFMRTLLCDPPDSVPYTEALALKRNSGGSSLGNGAARRPASRAESLTISSPELGAKLSELEQEREHYKLECELLKMKLTRFESVHGSHADQVKNGLGAGANDGARGRDGAAAGRSASSGAGGAGRSVGGGVAMMGEDEIERIREHYEGRIKSLMTQLQFADGKAVAFHDECRNIAMRFEVLRHSQAKQGEEYKSVNDTIAGLKADLESTKRNYEEQLSVMTEHVMMMNDQIQAKDVEIDAVRRQAKGGGSKSSWSSKGTSKKSKGGDALEFPSFSR